MFRPVDFPRRFSGKPMLLLLQLACDQNTYETPERLLDEPELTYNGAGNGGGAVEVSGDADEWTLVDADSVWTLSSPGKPDILALDGQIATVAVNRSGSDPDEGTDEPIWFHNLVIATDSTIEYAVSASEAYIEDTSPDGTTFVRYGDALGTLAREYWLLTVRELVFTTDEGDVALGPSDPTVLVFGGEQYLTTVLSAWESDILDESVGQPKCGGIGDRFSYEMVRLPPDAVVELPEVVERTGAIEGSPCG